MEMQTLNSHRNLFLNREEIVLEIISNTSPSFDDVKKAVGKDENLTVVKKISSNFGRKKFIAEVFVYGSKESKDRIETLPRKERDKIKEEKKVAAEAARKARAEAKKTNEVAA